MIGDRHLYSGSNKPLARGHTTLSVKCVHILRNAIDIIQLLYTGIIYFVSIIVSLSVMSNSLEPHGLYSPLGSSVLGILQARILEWVVIPFSRGSSQPRVWTCISCVSCTAGRFFTIWATKETHIRIDVFNQFLLKFGQLSLLSLRELIIINYYIFRYENHMLFFLIYNMTYRQ